MLKIINLIKMEKGEPADEKIKSLDDPKSPSDEPNSPSAEPKSLEETRSDQLEVAFRVDYNLPVINRDFGTVFLGNQNVAKLVVSGEWEKTREQGQQRGEVSPYLAELLRLEEQAKQEGLGRWIKTPGAAEASIRNLPPSSISDPSNLDAMGLLNANKGRPLEGIVEHVRDGSTIRVYLLPEFQFV